MKMENQTTIINVAMLDGYINDKDCNKTTTIKVQLLKKKENLMDQTKNTRVGCNVANKGTFAVSIKRFQLKVLLWHVLEGFS